jgi:hypothetical protein
MANFDKRLRALEAAWNSASTDDREEKRREIRRRISLGVLDELGKVRAPRFVRGQREPGPPLVEELFGEAWTPAQQHELAIRRAFDRLEEILAPGFVTMDDYRSYVDDEDLAPEGRSRLAHAWLEAQRLRREDAGEPWDEPNRWYRKRSESKGRQA